MNTQKFDEGVEVIVPEGFQVLSTHTQKAKSSRGTRKLKTSGTVAMPTDDGSTQDDSLVLNSLEQIGMELIQELEIVPISQPNLVRKRLPEEESEAEFKIDLAQNENAVMLLEQDGMYLWKYASQTDITPSFRRRGKVKEETQKRLIFQVDIGDSTEPELDETRRGIWEKVKEFAWGRVKAYILKFVASATVELAQKRLERNVSRGIVHITSTDPETWQLVNDIEKIITPSDRPHKILLLLHGTFSSTIGAFGALGATPWGKSFLQSVLNTYDVVIGFDHATLSEDPLQNAQQLLKAFKSVTWPAPPHFDIITHSRGGLVARCLIEKLLPQGDWQPKFNRVIYVASTNGGTLLAEPENWESLVNLYTNLAAGACRVIGLIAPQTKIVSLVLNEIIQSIGKFITYCADSAITNRLVPGLSAMEPDGDFIKDINLLQDGQPSIENSYYCAITSEFKPQLTGSHEPKELPKRFLTLFGGTFIKHLMKESNDLVVNTDSMGAIDLVVGSFIKERYDFGSNPQVYHTNYFTRPEVANALTRWLNLPPLKSEQVAEDTVRPKGRKRSIKNVVPPMTNIPKPLEPIPLIRSTNKTLSPVIDTDIITVNGNGPVGTLLTDISRIAPSYVVIQRPYNDTTLYYAFEAERVLMLAPGQTDNTPVIDALGLHEWMASGTQSDEESIEVKLPTDQVGDSPNITSLREVVLKGNVPVGVIPEKRELLDAESLANVAKIVYNPTTDEDRIIVRRTMPSSPVPLKMEIPLPGVICHFRAEMDAEVVVKRATTIIVTISRELLEQVVGGISADASREVNPEKKIVIRVITRSNFIVVDSNDGQAEIDVPKPNEPQELLFDVRATEEGKGEIWVLIRQDQVSVAKLVLKPKVVKSRKLSSEKLISERVTSDPKPLDKPLNQLVIEERKTVDGYNYIYRINSPGLKLNRKFTSENIIGDRQEYVASLYKQIEDRWISSGRDKENFAEELRAFGADLFNELIPVGLQKILWKRRKDFDSIQIISSEPFIPWELIHLRDPEKIGMPEETIFLAQMGLIRWLEGANEDGWPPELVKIRDGRVKYVIPKYPHPDYKLPEAEQEIEFLSDQFHAEKVESESGVIRKLIAKPGAFDLLHFACHGVANSDNISESSLLMQGHVENGNYVLDSLNTTVVSRFSNLKADDNNPMVVLNACQAGRAGYKLTGIGGFADAFLMGGAGAFVGALWSVGDSPARTFTETMYEKLISGKNLSEATIEARNAAKEAGEATWLAYAVYGHPHMKISRE